MAPRFSTNTQDSSDPESGSDSDGGSGSSSSRSDSPASHTGVAPTPGHGYPSPSPSVSPHSHRSRSKSVAESVRSRTSSGSEHSPVHSIRSPSPAQSEASKSPRSPHSISMSHHSRSPGSHATKSPLNSELSNKSLSPAASEASHSPSPTHSNSRSPKSIRSVSHSPVPRSPSAARSGTQSPHSSSDHSRSASPQHNRSDRSASHESRSSKKSHNSRMSIRSGSNRSITSDKSHKSSPGQSTGSRSPRSPSIARSEGSKSSGSHRSGSVVSNQSGSPQSPRSRKSSRSPKSGSASPGSPHSTHRSGTRSRSQSVDRQDGSDIEKGGSKHSESEDGEKSDKKQDGLSDTETHVNKRKKDVLTDSGSGSDVVKIKKKPRIGSGSGEDSERERKDSVDAEALFGDADDISSDDEEEKNANRRASVDERRESDIERQRSDGDHSPRRVEDELAEEKEIEEPPPETRIDVEIPKITCDLGKEIHFVKMPNFLSVETRPFDPETYEDEIDEEETLDEEGRARLKLKVENTIRWRDVLDKDGNMEKESNSRFIRWSDGSMSLHLGCEIFDVHKQPLQGDHNHLFIRQGTGLQGQAVFRTKLTFRPHSTESFTHRKMTLSLADRSQKTSGIKVLSQVGFDPDQNRYEKIKKEEEKLRASMRKESKQKRVRERGANRGLSTSYLEPDQEGSDDEGAISLSAIKSKYKKGGKGSENKRNIYSSDEDGSDLDTRRGKKLDKSKALKDSDDEESGDGDRVGTVASDSDASNGGKSSGSGGQGSEGGSDDD